MAILKQIKDYFKKHYWYGETVPVELFELSQYFRHNEPIKFSCEKKDKMYIAVSQNFRYGTIITSAESPDQLNEKIKDAILTAFEVPSSYAKEANIKNVREEQYAFA